jgi:tetratricopeptide (TPR) repeat protein
MKKILLILFVTGLVLPCSIYAGTKTAVKIFNNSLKEADDTKKVEMLHLALAQKPRVKKVKAAIYNSLALAYKRLGNYAKSKYYFNLAIKNASKNYYYRANRCSLHTLMGKYDNAIVDCQSALKLGPKRGHDYYALANVYHKMGNYELAEKYYKTAIKKSPEKCFYYYQLGLVYYASQEYEKAIDSYNITLKLCKGYTNAYANRGDAYYKLAAEDLTFYDKALEDYERAGKLDSENTEYTKKKIYASISLGECGKTLKDISKLIGKQPKDPDTYLAFALYWTCKGVSQRNNKKALKYIQLAIDAGFRDFEKFDAVEPYKTFFPYITSTDAYAKIKEPYSNKSYYAKP